MRPDRAATLAAMAKVQEGLPAQDTSWVFQVLPRRVDGWRIVQRATDGYAARRHDGLAAIISGRVEQDGKRWLHLSVSRPKGLPTYHDLKAAKRDWLGDTRYGYQVFAPTSDHVNIGEVLHIFACVDQPMALPDFTGGTGSI